MKRFADKRLTNGHGILLAQQAREPQAEKTVATT
jgi:hypothetical protein